MKTCNYRSEDYEFRSRSVRAQFKILMLALIACGIFSLTSLFRELYFNIKGVLYPPPQASSSSCGRIIYIVQMQSWQKPGNEARSIPQDWHLDVLSGKNLKKKNTLEINKMTSLKLLLCKSPGTKPKQSTCQIFTSVISGIESTVVMLCA